MGNNAIESEAMVHRQKCVESQGQFAAPGGGV